MELNGKFEITGYDKENNIIYEHKDNNKIQARDVYNFADTAYGNYTGFNNELPSGITMNDLFINTIILGTDGNHKNVTNDGVVYTVKELPCNRDMLFSEQKLFNSINNNTITPESKFDDQDKYLYRVKFEPAPQNINYPKDFQVANKLEEGVSFPFDYTNNKPMFYKQVLSQQDNQQNVGLEDASMQVKTRFKNLTLSYEFTLGQLAGNGDWEFSPYFSEAGLYMNYTPDKPEYQNSIIEGALFCMKTFPRIPKTELCTLKIKWDIIFGNNTCTSNEPFIDLIGPETEYVQYQGAYVDQGATAWDQIDGDITSDIQTVTDVVQNQPGEYSVIYTVKNSQDIETIKIRKVIIT